MINVSKNIFKAITGLLLGLVFASCSTVKYVPVNNKVDSVIVEKIVERTDTISVYLPDQSKEVAVIDNNSHLETDYATSNAWVDSLSILHHTLANKPETPLKKEIVYKDKIIEKEVTKEVEVPVEVYIPEKYVPSFYKFSLWWFIGTLLLIIGYFVIKILLKK